MNNIDRAKKSRSSLEEKLSELTSDDNDLTAEDANDLVILNRKLKAVK